MDLQNLAMKPVRGVGGFYAMALDTVVAIPRRPFAWREFFLQCWFIARVSVVPALLLALPFTVLVAFTLNVLLVDFGAADAAGTGAGIAMAQLGPVVTVLAAAGPGPTAICPDLAPPPLPRAVRDEPAGRGRAVRGRLMSAIVSTPSNRYPRRRRTFGGFARGWNRIGRQTQFYGLTLRSIGIAVVRYKAEIIRLIAQMSLGTGALALIGGTVVVGGFLPLPTGAVIAVQGRNQPSRVGG